jgi:hypothetical protein
MLVAALMLVARLIAPASAMPSPASPADLAVAAALQTICHGGLPDAPDQPVRGPVHHDCLLCPACHLLAHAAIPLSSEPALPVPVARWIGAEATLPPATGPPERPRLVAQPTGPPTLSV